MMRPKVFNGTNSMSCANRVLPTFMRHSGGGTARSIANWRGAVQIVDTRESSETTISIDFAVDHAEMDQAPLIHYDA